MRSRGDASLATFGLAVLAAAAVTAMLGTAILATPNLVYDWMLVSVPPETGLTVAALKSCAAIFLIATASIAVAALVSDRIPGQGGDLRLVALVCLASFLVMMLFEMIWHIPGGAGNLSASNPAGLAFDEGHLTALGWTTAVRRAVVASCLGLAMGMTFAGVRRLSAGQRR